MSVFTVYMSVYNNRKNPEVQAHMKTKLDW